MSYDFYLWADPNPVTAEQAAQICESLATGENLPTKPAARNLAFAAELIEQYPRLEDLTEDDYSPWNMSPYVTDCHVILCMGLSRVSEVGSHILELADRHSLVCYDPSARRVYHPAAPSGTALPE